MEKNVSATDHTANEATSSSTGGFESEENAAILSFSPSHNGQNSSQEDQRGTPKSEASSSAQNEVATPTQVVVSNDVPSDDLGEAVDKDILQMSDLVDDQAQLFEKMKAAEFNPENKNLGKSTSKLEMGDNQQQPMSKDAVTHFEVNIENNSSKLRTFTNLSEDILIPRDGETTENDSSKEKETAQLNNSAGFSCPKGGNIDYAGSGMVSNDTENPQNMSKAINCSKTTELSQQTQNDENDDTNNTAIKSMSSNENTIDETESTVSPESRLQSLNDTQNGQKQQLRSSHQILKELFDCTEQIIMTLSQTYSTATLKDIFEIDGNSGIELLPEDLGKYNYRKFLETLYEFCAKDNENKRRVDTFSGKLSKRSSDGDLKSINNTLFLIFWVKTMCWISDNNPSLQLGTEILELSNRFCSCCCFCCGFSGFQCGFLCSFARRLFLSSSDSSAQLATTVHNRGVGFTELQNRESTADSPPVGSSLVTPVEDISTGTSAVATHATQSENGEEELTTAANFLDYLGKENFRESLEARCFLVNFDRICGCGGIVLLFQSFHEKFFLQSYTKHNFIRRHYKKVSLGRRCCGACFIFIYNIVIILGTLTGIIFLIWKCFE